MHETPPLGGNDATAEQRELAKAQMDADNTLAKFAGYNRPIHMSAEEQQKIVELLSR